MKLERRSIGAAVAAITALGVTLRFAFLSRHALWHDEAWSLQFIRLSWPSVFIAEWQSPPVFWVLLKAWQQLTGAREAWTLRVLPAAIGSLALWPCWLLARNTLRPAPALLGFLLIALNPWLVYFSGELRAYTLMVLCAISALALHSESLEPSRGSGRLREALLALALTVGLHSHYMFIWAWAVVAGHRLWNWRARGTSAWTLAPLAGSGVAFLPWMAFFLSHTNTEERGFISDLVARMASMPLFLLLGESAVVRNFGTSAVEAARRHAGLLVLFFLSFIPLALWGARELWRSVNGRLVLAALGVPQLLLLLLFPWVPLYSARYIAFSAVLLCILCAAGLGSRGREGRWLAVPLMVLVGLQLFSLGRYGFDSRYGREDWAVAVGYVSARLDAGDVVLFDKSYMRAPFDTYFAGEAREIGVPPLPEEGTRSFLKDVLASHTGKVVLVTSHTWFDREDLTARVLSTLRCLRERQVFERSYGIEVHVFTPCPGGGSPTTGL